jgi:hypothetical protein
VSLLDLTPEELVEEYMTEVLVHFDPLIDGDITNVEDLYEFMYPFLRTITIKQENQ